MKELIRSIIKEYSPSDEKKSVVHSRALTPLGYAKDNKEILDKFYRVSKIEENEALNFIRNRVMDYAIGVFKLQYSHQLISKGEHGELSVNEVNRRLKKISDERYPEERKKDVIQYAAPLIKHYHIVFNIFKSEPGDLVVGFIQPVNRSVKYFMVNGPERLTPIYEADAPKPVYPQFFKEAIERDWHITKLEEQKALQFIRNSLLSQVVEDYNEAAQERKVPVVHHGPEERAVIDSLRKVQHTEFPEHKTDQILYVADFQNWQWVFIIEKVGMGVRIPFLRAGYIDDRWNESKMYDINIPRPDDPAKQWQDPKSAFKKINDFMPHMPFGTPGLLRLKKKKNEISEGYGKHNLTLTKKEEDFAFHLLKQAIFDDHARKTIRKVTHIHNHGSHYVPDKIVYEVVYSNDTVAWFTIEKNSRTGKLVYYPSDKEGERTGHRHDSPLESDEDNGLIESIYQTPNLHISKAEEAWALQQLRKRKNSQGESIGKYLRKIEHTVSSDPHLSDRIKFVNSDDASTYTIVKNRVDGKLGYRAGYRAFKQVTPYGARERDDYESSEINDFEVPLHEADISIKEYVNPPWPKAVLTKKDEARAVQFIKILTDKLFKITFPNGKIEKTIRKENIVPSENPDVVSDRSVYLVTLSGNQTYTYEIYFSNRLGLVVDDRWTRSRYYIDTDKPENYLKENIESEPILTKQDEARAVQFIRGITDSGMKPYGKTLKKLFNKPSESESLSHSAYYQGNLSNGDPMTFRVFRNAERGLIVRDEVNCVSYMLDEPDPYGAPFKPKYRPYQENLKEEMIDPKLRISKKEEAQAFAWLSNLTEKGERFGKGIKKASDDIEDGKHVIKYLVDAGGTVGIFSISKNQAGWIIIRSNYGAVMHIIKNP